MLTNFLLLHDPHNGCMLPMSSEPPLVRGTTWSACNTAPVSPQARHLLPSLSQSTLNSSAVKLPELACLDPMGRFALALSYWAYCSRFSRRYFCARALTQTLHFFPSVRHRTRKVLLSDRTIYTFC